MSSLDSHQYACKRRSRIASRWSGSTAMRFHRNYRTSRDTLWRVLAEEVAEGSGGRKDKSLIRAVHYGVRLVFLLGLYRLRWEGDRV